MVGFVVTPLKPIMQCWWEGVSSLKGLNGLRNSLSTSSRPGTRGRVKVVVLVVVFSVKRDVRFVQQ